MTQLPPMWMRPDVGGLMRPMAREQRGFAGSARAEQCDDFAAATRSETSFMATTSVLPLP